CATQYEITPYTPIVAMNSASPANKVSRTARNRQSVKDAALVSSIVSTRPAGWLGSNCDKTERIDAAGTAPARAARTIKLPPSVSGACAAGRYMVGAGGSAKA